MVCYQGVKCFTVSSEMLVLIVWEFDVGSSCLQQKSMERTEALDAHLLLAIGLHVSHWNPHTKPAVPTEAHQTELTMFSKYGS